MCRLIFLHYVKEKTLRMLSSSLPLKIYFKLVCYLALQPLKAPTVPQFIRTSLGLIKFCYMRSNQGPLRRLIVSLHIVQCDG